MKNLVFLALILFSMLAHAEDSAEQSRSSRKDRSDKVWGWEGEAGNFTVGNKATMGVGAGLFFYLDSNDILSIETGAGTNYDFISSIAGDTVNGSDNRLGVYYKGFVGNSFYLKVGLEGDQISYNVTHYPAFGGSSYSQTANLNLYEAYLGFGNSWQIRHLTIGCDWAALLVPFANSGFTETDSGPVFDSWNLKSRLTAMGAVFARFYIGMSF